MKYLQYIKEYLQQAEKIYFKPNLLSNDDKKIILDITKGDEYTRLLSDWYYHVITHLFKDRKKDEKFINTWIHDFYKYLKEYKSDIFPVGIIENRFKDNPKIHKKNIQDFSYFTKNNELHIFNLFSILENRHLLISEYNKLPNLAKRNIKEKSDIIYNEYIAKDYYEKIRDINNILSRMPIKVKERAIKKAFTSKNNIKKMSDIIRVFANGITNIDSEYFDLDDFISDISNDLGVDIIQHDKEVLVLKVNNQESMSYIANLSDWCFIYDDVYWDEYSRRRGYIYLVIDLSLDISDARFMLCIVDTGEVYVSTNLPLNDLEEFQDNPIGDYEYLEQIGVKTELLK